MRLVLVSGWATTGRVWGSVVPLLSGWDSIDVLDCLSAMRGGLRKLLEATPEPCVVAGWSMGGQIALKESFNMADRVRGIFLASSMVTLVGGDGMPGVDREVPAAIRLMLLQNRRAYLRAFFRDCILPARDVDLVAEMTSDALGIELEGLLEGLDFMSRNRSPLHRSIPVKVIHGLEDRVIPWECSRVIAGRSGFPSAMYLEGTGHLVPLLEPEITGRMIDEFRDLLQQH